MTKHPQGPTHTRRTEKPQFFSIIDYDIVVATDTQVAHRFGKGLTSGEHVRIRRLGILDSIQVEVARLGNAILLESVNSLATFGVVRHEPGGAERDNARRRRDSSSRVLPKSFIEFLGGDQI